MNSLLVGRNEQLRRVCTPLPGKQPYENIRPINVPGRFDGQTLLECLTQMHPHVDRDLWTQWFESGLIRDGKHPATMNQRVRAGNQYQHVFPETVEPDVNSDVQILWEDKSFIALHKPAPMPVHPCGRFNLNSLTSLLGKVYTSDELRLVHRLDANTSGVLLIARTRAVATCLRNQFDKGTVRKRYLVRCNGRLSSKTILCELPIGRDRGKAGSRQVDVKGLAAKTIFHSLRQWKDGTTLCEALPQTGRTHQIRIHLWAMGNPIVGDPAYLADDQIAETQTLAVDDPPMCLHASRVTFEHPASGETMTLETPNPDWARGAPELA